MSRPSAVRRVRWRPWRIPFARPHVAAHGANAVREGVVVVVETDEGVGLGEASPLPSFSGGSLAAAERDLESSAHVALGRTPADLWAAGLVLPGAAACAFETALADLRARAADVPAAAWLARESGAPAATTAPIPVNALIDAAEPEAVAEAARCAVDAGFRTLKLKVGLDEKGDLDRVRALRDAVGDASGLRVDANGAWDTDAARPMLAAIAPHGVELCEQPLAPGPGELERLAALRADSPIPIAADESCPSPEAAAALIAARAVDAIVVKPMVTGLRGALAITERAREGDLSAIVTTTFDAGIGTAVALHLAALLPEPRPACGLATLDRLEGDFVTGVPAVRDGTIAVGGALGFGLTLDEAALEHWAVGPWREVAA